jgi:hypothetical protein
MIELWVRPTGLRRGHDPSNPQLTDIVGTPSLASMAHRVVLETEEAAFVRKGEDIPSKECLRVEFDPDRGFERLKVVHNVRSDDLMKLASMREALQNDWLGGAG